jgi:hypothetical protein
MKPIFVITLLFLTCSHSFGQTQEKTTAPAGRSKSEAASDSEFEKYCLANATRVITVPAEKAAGLKISGEVAMPSNKQATYRDYGVTLKENETQYFTIAGSDQFLAVSSVYRLRTAYNAEK